MAFSKSMVNPCFVFFSTQRSRSAPEKKKPLAFFPSPPSSIIQHLTSHISHLTSHFSLLTSHFSLLTFSLLTSHFSLLASHISLLTSHYLTSHFSLLTSSSSALITSTPPSRDSAPRYDDRTIRLLVVLHHRDQRARQSSPEPFSVWTKRVLPLSSRY